VTLQLDAAWRDRLRAQADQPPRVTREPLWAAGAMVGSVEPDFFPTLKLPFWVVLEKGTGWELQGDITQSLHAIAHAMREAGLAHVWRDEQLPVTDEAGRVVGTVERAAVRPLGITTFAVHLAGFAPDGRHWIQQRSLTKANDPGLWDTLMGGLVPATDTLQRALERETWEEAGLRLDQLRELAHGGRVTTRRPARDVPMGYIVEHIDWYRCVVPEGVVPENQDGEVRQFALAGDAEVLRRLLGDEFTHEAALVLSESAP
jgi:8-oxo-dGTP pyrophosphatase MutT (NUDIX family)